MSMSESGFSGNAPSGDAAQSEMDILQQRAAQGDANAQYILGRAFIWQGQVEAGIQWIQHACNGGHQEACAYLAGMVNLAASRGEACSPHAHAQAYEMQKCEEERKQEEQRKRDEEYNLLMLLGMFNLL